MELHNNSVLETMLASTCYTEEVKNSFRRSKEDFDKGVKRECQLFKEQFAKFNSSYVLLEKYSGQPKFSEVKFVPRNFTLYSLVQRQLLKTFLEKNQLGFSIYEQCCLCCSHSKWRREEPVSTLAKVFSTISHNLMETLGEEENLEGILLESIETAVAFHPRSVEADKACLRKMFPSLPPLLLGDLFTFLMYYGFENLLVFARGPNPDNDFIDVDNFFKQFYCHKDILIPLPHAEWDPTRDYSVLL